MGCRRVVGTRRGVLADRARRRLALDGHTRLSAGVLADPRPALRAVRGGLHTACALLLAEPALGPAGNGRMAPDNRRAAGPGARRPRALVAAAPGAARACSRSFSRSASPVPGTTRSASSTAGRSGSRIRSSGVMPGSMSSGYRCSRRSCAGSSSSRSSCCSRRRGSASGLGVFRDWARLDDAARGAMASALGRNLALVALAASAGYVLDRFGLLYASSGTVWGPGYVERARGDAGALVNGGDRARGRGAGGGGRAAPRPAADGLGHRRRGRRARRPAGHPSGGDPCGLRRSERARSRAALPRAQHRLHPQGLWHRRRFGAQLSRRDGPRDA